jgi:hypothetical protein
VPSHALPSGPETRTRRRARRREGRRRLRDWRTWGVFLTVVASLQLSGAIVGHFWPKAHGVGYVVTHVVVGGVLGGAIGAVLVVVVVILDRRQRHVHTDGLRGGAGDKAINITSSDRAIAYCGLTLSRGR